MEEEKPQLTPDQLLAFRAATRTKDDSRVSTRVMRGGTENDEGIAAVPTKDSDDKSDDPTMKSDEASDDTAAKAESQWRMSGRTQLTTSW